MWLHSRKSRLISSFVSRILFAILGCLRPRPHVCGNFCIRKFFFFEFKNIFYSDFARWASAKSYVGAVLLTTFQGPRSIRHVDLSHPGKTGSDSVTSAHSKICGTSIVLRRISVDAARIPDTCGRGLRNDDGNGNPTKKIISLVKIGKILVLHVQHVF